MADTLRDVTDRSAQVKILLRLHRQLKAAHARCGWFESGKREGLFGAANMTFVLACEVAGDCVPSDFDGALADARQVAESL